MERAKLAGHLLKQTWEKGQVLWRAEDSISRGVSWVEGDTWLRLAPVVKVNWVQYEVVRLTRCGAHLRSERGDETWRTRRTDFVSATKAEAIRLAILRRAHHVKMAAQRLEDAKLRLAELRRELEGLKLPPQLEREHDSSGSG